MRILVTNDDGVESPGIVALAETLRVLGDVLVVAPDSDRSGVAHSLSIRHPVRVRERNGFNVPTYECTGTPADCVVVGAYELCDGVPDIVVSGINRGANVGDDINYSGTIAAANEGLLLGVPSVAVSLAATWPIAPEDVHWATAAHCALEAVRGLPALGLPNTTLLNINVPNVPLQQLNGTRYTKQARKRYTDRTDRRVDPRGETYVWIWGSLKDEPVETNTDIEAMRAGFVSITPITIDRTDERTFHRLNES